MFRIKPTVVNIPYKILNPNTKYNKLLNRFFSTMNKSPGIKVSKLSLQFRDKIIFEDLDFQLSAHDKLTLVGQNGVGKSTFLRILAGENIDYGGKVLVRGQIGYLPQSFETFKNIRGLEHFIEHSKDSNLQSFLNHSQEYFSDKWYKEFNDLSKARVWKILSELNLNERHLQKNLSELSGGEKVRLHLGALCYSDADILVLDEPTNHLDFQGLKWLERYLKSFSGGIVMVTHDRALISHTSNRISELSPITHKFVHFYGGYKSYLVEQEKIFTRTQQKRLRQEKELTVLEKKITASNNKFKTVSTKSTPKDNDKLSFKAKGERSEKGHSKTIQQFKRKVTDLKENITEVPEERKKIDVNLMKSIKTSDISISVEGLSIAIGGIKLFNAINFSLSKGEKLIITGKNGTGKTTLLKILQGNIQPDTGTIQKAGDVITGYLDQEHEELDLDKNAYEVLESEAGGNLSKREIIDLLQELGLYSTNDIYTPLEHLSIGCRRKVQLAAIVAKGANLLLLDEPTNHIDLLSMEAIEDQLIKFPGIVIATSHDRHFIDVIGSHELILDEYGQ